MNAIVLNVVIDENHRLIVDVPDDFPVGPAQVAIMPVVEAKSPEAPLEFENLTREEIRARFLKAGILNTTQYAPDDAAELSDKERDGIGRLFAGPRPVEDDINEDREERF